MSKNEFWRWNVNPTWHHCSSMYEEAYKTKNAPHEFSRFHHFRACLYFAVGTVESFLNEEYRAKRTDEGISDDEIKSKIRNTSLKKKIDKWPSKITGSNVNPPAYIDKTFPELGDMRNEVTHPKHEDHSIYRDLNETEPSLVIESVTEYLASVYGEYDKRYPYWLLGWNYVGINDDETHPALLNNQQFRFSLYRFGFKVPTHSYKEGEIWEEKYMTSLEGFRQLSEELKTDESMVEERDPNFPKQPRLTNRWWDQDFLKSE